MRAFGADLLERVAWSAGGGAVAFVVESELGSAHLPMIVRALMYAAGCAGASLVKCLVVRNRFGAHGTAGSTHAYSYPAAPDKPCKLRAVK